MNKKSILLLVVILLLCVIFIELITPRIYLGITKNYFSREHLQVKLLSTKDDNFSNVNFFKENYVLHPFTGYVLDPKRHPGSNKLGFLGQALDREHQDDEIMILITGGSVAAQFFQVTQQELAKDIEDVFPNRKISIVSTALSGYKQPQQLLSLIYLLSLGKRFDMIINLDGVNEIAVAKWQIDYFDLNPHFPFNWPAYNIVGNSLEHQFLLIKIVKIKTQQSKLRSFFSKKPFIYSNYMLATWDLLDKKNENNLRIATYEYLKRGENKTEEFQTVGPKYKGTNVFEDTAEVWKDSSKLMHMTTKSNGIPYFHFLQPNHFLMNKTLTEEEKLLMYETKNINYIKHNIQKGYPYLSAKGDELHNEGVNFVDLSSFFENETETVFSDCCIHFTRDAYHLLEKEIFEHVKKEMIVE